MRTTWICYWCEKEQDTDGFPAPMQKCEECIKPLEEARANHCEYCENGETHEEGAIYPCHAKKAVRAIPEWAEKVKELIELHINGEDTRSQFYKDLEPLIESLLTTREAEAYKQGQMNPQVGFLRQYLNEDGRPAGKGEMWKDEDILRFLRIPFTTNPKENV